MEMWISLEGNNGKYVAAEWGGGNGGVLHANRDAASTWETFYLRSPAAVLASGVEVSLAAFRGHYVSAEGGGGGDVNANRGAAAAWEKLTLVRADGKNAPVASGDRVALRASGGQYLRASSAAGDDGLVIADGAALGADETFTLEIQWALPAAAAPEAALLTLGGDAVMKEITSHESDGTLESRVALFNAAGTPVHVDRALWFQAFPGGVVVDGPSRLVPPPPAPEPSFGFSADVPAHAGPALAAGPKGGYAQHLYFLVNASAAGRAQCLWGDVPVAITPETARTGHWNEVPAAPRPPVPPSAPEPLRARGPVLMTVLGTVDAWPDSNGGVFVPVTGQLLNGTGRALRVTHFEYTLFDAAGHAQRRDVALNVDLPDGPTLASGPSMPQTPAPVLAFSFGVSAPAGLDLSSAFITLRGRAETDVETLDFERTIPVQAPQLDDLDAPVDRAAKGAWNAGNGPQPDGFNGHNGSLAQRYAYDLGIWVNEQSSPPGSDPNKNASYYCYGLPIRAMAKGQVVHIVDGNPENNGGIGNPAHPDNNVVVLRHDNGCYSVYAHMRPGSIAKYVSLGATVLKGQQIAEIGNVGGSSEPHLHVAYWKLDERDGFYRSLPMRWTNATTPAGQPLSGVALNRTAFQVAARTMTVSATPSQIRLEQPVTVTFRANDAANGLPVKGAVLVGGTAIGDTNVSISATLHWATERYFDPATRTYQDRDVAPSVVIRAPGYADFTVPVRFTA